MTSVHIQGDGSSHYYLDRYGSGEYGELSVAASTFLKDPITGLANRSFDGGASVLVVTSPLDDLGSKLFEWEHPLHEDWHGPGPPAQLKPITLGL
mmetsp:Transcript_18626/g.57388  ORF Transcript_18626/g.57388 Transcript_18626/m.57388 type:complete len:95 (-) Transcript_18626:24-308(-)